MFKMHFRGIGALIYNSGDRNSFSLYKEFMNFLLTNFKGLLCHVYVKDILIEEAKGNSD